MAAPYSSTVFTLSSARGLGWSSSCVSRVDQEFARAVAAGGDVRGERGARARLVDGAQRFGQAVVAASETRWRSRAGRARAISVSSVARVEERQVAGQHQPGGVRVLGERGADAGDGALDVAAIDDVRDTARARGSSR